MLIKINLAKKKKRASGSGGGDRAGSGGGSGFAKMFQGAFKISESVDGADFNPRRFLFVLIALAGTYYYADEMKKEEVEIWQGKITKAQGEQKKLNADLARYKNLEAVKKRFESHEAVLKKKVEVLEPLLRQQVQPHRVLIAVSKTIPPDLWLRSLRFESSKAELRGASLGGLNSISDLMKNLASTAYFSDVRLANSQREKEEGRDVSTFSLEARRP